MPWLTVALGMGVIPVYKIEFSRMSGPKIKLDVSLFTPFVELDR
jgi:hypothetical protein